VRTRTTAEAVIGGALASLDAPEALLLGRPDPDGRLRVAGRTAALPPPVRRELGALLVPPDGPHPWPRRIPSSRFGHLPSKPIDYTPTEPLVVVEVDTRHGQSRRLGVRGVGLRRLRLRHKDNHVRTIAGQLLCNLAKSDPELRILDDLPALLELTKDNRFATARHCLQALRKVGAAGEAQRAAYQGGMVQRFVRCDTAKNWSLIRFDVLQSMRNVYDVTGDDSIRTTAQELIDSEADVKYRKKYAGLWKLSCKTSVQTAMSAFPGYFWQRRWTASTAACTS
jgi:hypothetical protein